MVGSRQKICAIFDGFYQFLNGTTKFLTDLPSQLVISNAIFEGISDVFSTCSTVSLTIKFSIVFPTNSVENFIEKSCDDQVFNGFFHHKFRHNKCIFVLVIWWGRGVH